MPHQILSGKCFSVIGSILVGEGYASRDTIHSDILVHAHNRVAQRIMHELEHEISFS